MTTDRRFTVFACPASDGRTPEFNVMDGGVRVSQPFATKAAAQADADRRETEADFAQALASFKDFSAASLPMMPEGFEDTSWHNDSSPSIESRALGLRVWIDYFEPAEREIPELPRFTVQGIDADGETLNEDDLLNTDEWADVLALIATRKEA